MAGFGPSDINNVTEEEEPVLKKVIAQAWQTMKRTNWQDTKYCTINPKNVLTYSQARNFKSFYEKEGWHVVIKRKERNYFFDVYQELEFNL